MIPTTFSRNAKNCRPLRCREWPAVGSRRVSAALTLLLTVHLMMVFPIFVNQLFLIGKMLLVEIHMPPRVDVLVVLRQCSVQTRQLKKVCQTRIHPVSPFSCTQIRVCVRFLHDWAVLILILFLHDLASSNVPVIRSIP